MIRLFACCAVMAFNTLPALALDVDKAMAAQQLAEAKSAGIHCNHLTLNRDKMDEVSRIFEHERDEDKIRRFTAEALVSAQAFREVHGVTAWCRHLESQYGPDGTVYAGLLDVK